MRFFPQLWTGASGQYPLVRRRITRTVTNTLMSGWQRKSIDAGERRVEWDLVATGLTTTERDELQNLFDDVEGRLETFTFLDPMQNLFLWSEDLTASAWLRGPLLQFTGNMPDPFDETRSVRISNVGAAAQQVTQSIGGPAWYQYCLSMWARTDAATDLTLLRFANGNTDSSVLHVTTNWNRLCFSGKLNSTSEGVVHGIELPAGATVEIFGIQLEPQVGASGYKRRGGETAVFDKCRFREDHLTFTAEGPNEYSTSLGIMANL
jgi:hypothetical protein